MLSSVREIGIARPVFADRLANNLMTYDLAWYCVKHQKLGGDPILQVTAFHRSSPFLTAPHLVAMPFSRHAVLCSRVRDTP